MSANELADDLDHIYELSNIFECKAGADTIREQQAEIEALKAKLQLHEAMDNQCASLMQQFRKAQEK